MCVPVRVHVCLCVCVRACSCACVCSNQDTDEKSNHRSFVRKIFKGLDLKLRHLQVKGRVFHSGPSTVKDTQTFLHELMEKQENAAKSSKSPLSFLKLFIGPDLSFSQADPGPWALCLIPLS